MKNKVKELKVELLKTIKPLPLSGIISSLNGRDGIRGYSMDMDGYYCNNSDYGIDIVGKDGLELTFKISDDEGEYESVFENTQEYEDEMEIEDWDGIWKETLRETTGIHILLELLGLN